MEPILRQMEVGPMKNYQYFIGCGRTREVAVVDPAWDVPFLLAEAQRLDVRIRHVLVSHGHGDHVNGVAAILDATDATVHVNDEEVSFFGLDWPASSVHRTRHGDELAIGDVDIELVHTPGHTPGSQSFLVRVSPLGVAQRLVTGDTLFVDGCGRCDLPGGDPVQMYGTLRERILSLPGSTIVLPGHNYAPKSTDTLEAQRRTNRFFLCRDLPHFLQVRMGQ